MKKKILLADEDVPARRMIARVLETAGYAVVQVPSWESAQGKVPDLAVLDWKTPDGDGCRCLASFSQVHPGVPVVALTAWPMRSDHSLSEEADAVLEKPLDLPLLLETIERLLMAQSEESAAAVA